MAASGGHELVMGERPRPQALQFDLMTRVVKLVPSCCHVAPPLRAT